jgi:hypothetical protein
MGDVPAQYALRSARSVAMDSPLQQTMAADVRGLDRREHWIKPNQGGGA